MERAEVVVLLRPSAQVPEFYFTGAGAEMPQFIFTHSEW